MADIVTESARSKVRGFGKRLLGNENAVLVIILAILVAAFSVVSKGAATSWTNVLNVLLRSSSTGVAAIGQFAAVLLGGIDVSIGGVAVFTMCFGASLMTGPGTGAPEYLANIALPIVLAIAISLLLGSFIGAANGFFISRVGAPALILTLATWQITIGTSFIVTSGYRIKPPEALAFFGQGQVAGIPLPFIIFVVVAVIAYFVLHHTTYGKSLYAVGGNEISAWLSGININRVKLLAYVISGFLAGLAGTMGMARTMIASVDSMSTLMLDTVAAVLVGGVSLLGGRGTIVGVILGMLIMSVIANGMNVLLLGTVAQAVLRGVIIAVAVGIDMHRRGLV